MISQVDPYRAGGRVGSSWPIVAHPGSLARARCRISHEIPEPRSARYVLAVHRMLRAWATALAAVCFVFGTLACGKVDGSGGGGSDAGGTLESAVPPFVVGTRLTPRFLDAGDDARVLFDFI